MERQNITLSLPKAILREVKHLAVEKGTSVSRLLAAYLERMLADDEEYRRCMERARKRMKNGFDLGSKGKRDWTREELHER